MADIVFAFDPAIDRPVPRLDGAVPAVAEPVASAPFDALRAAAAAARQAEAAALVLFGRVLDPQRASPAQAAALRRLITDLASHGCRTVWIAADAAACADVSRMLGDPAGLVFVTPTQSLGLDIRGLAVEIHASQYSAQGLVGMGDGLAELDPLHAASTRRIVVGWDAGHWSHERWDEEPHAADARQCHAAAAGPQTTFCVWGSRRRHAPGGGVHHLPAIQARSAHEANAGGCGLLTLLDHPAADEAAALGHRHDPLTSRTDWRHAWRELPTHQVAWRTIAVESPAGGDEELATAIWSAIEGLSLDDQGPLQIIRCHVQCGTSVARRVRASEISAETLARVRQLYDAHGFRAWCHEIVADPAESLAALGHSRSGAQPGSTTSFSTALADIVTAYEQTPLRPVPADLARESAWLALELIEST